MSMKDAPLYFGKTLEWELTYRCNLSCKHCISPYYSDSLGPELSLEECLDGIESFMQAGVKHVHFLGGEPTFRPDFVTLIQALDEQGISTSFTTNGTLLVSYGLLGALKKLKLLKGVTVSFEDVRKKQQNRIRGDGFYQIACEALTQLAKDLPEIQRTVAFTLNGPALRGVHPADLLIFFAKLNVSRVLFQDLAIPENFSYELELLKYSFEELSNFFNKLYSSQAQEDGCIPFIYDMKPRVASYLNIRFGLNIPIVRYGCEAMSTRLRLLADGTVIPCLAIVGWPSELEKYKLELPKLSDAPLKDIISHKLFQNFVDKKISKFRNAFMSPCDDCRYAYKLCNPCVFGRVTKTKQIVNICKWVKEAEDSSLLMG